MALQSTDCFLTRNRNLYYIAALIWGIPGCIIAVKGLKAYMIQPYSDLWWLLLITAGVMSGFFLMFRRIVSRYMDRIAGLPELVPIWQTFPFRGWILLVFMMGLGVALKHIPNVPSAFDASFYSGLGPMLIMSAIRFFRH